MTRDHIILAAASLGLALSPTSVRADTCERGYVTEILESAKGTAPGVGGYPRLLFRTDQTGFKPLALNLRKIQVNDRSYSMIMLTGTSDAERLAYEAKVQTIRSAMLARTPIRVYYFDESGALPNCGTGADLVEVLLCTSETACDL